MPRKGFCGVVRAARKKPTPWANNHPQANLVKPNPLADKPDQRLGYPCAIPNQEITHHGAAAFVLPESGCKGHLARVFFQTPIARPALRADVLSVVLSLGTVFETTRIAPTALPGYDLPRALPVFSAGQIQGTGLWLDLRQPHRRSPATDHSRRRV